MNKSDTEKNLIRKKTLEKLKGEKDSLKEYTLTDTITAADEMGILKQAPLLQKIIIKTSLVKSDYNLLSELLDANIQVNEVAGLPTDPTELLSRAKRNLLMQQCRKAPGRDAIELNYDENFDVILNHPGWKEIFANRQKPLKIKCGIVYALSLKKELINSYIQEEKIEIYVKKFMVSRKDESVSLAGVREIYLLDVVENRNNNSYYRYQQPNSATIPCFEEIIKLIASNKPVSYLCLANSGINDTQLDELSKALEHNTFLIYLDLSLNPFTVTGAKLFFSRISTNRFITSIRMEYSTIKGDELKSIRDTLKNNHALLELAISPRQSEKFERGWSEGRQYSTPQGYFKRDSNYITNYLSNNRSNRDKAILAIRDQKFKDLKSLLQAGVSPNARDDNGRTLLHHAVEVDSLEMVGYLKMRSANFCLLDKSGKSIFAIAPEDMQQKLKELAAKPTPVKVTPKRKANSIMSYFATKPAKRVKTSTVEVDDSSKNLNTDNLVEFHYACMNGDNVFVQEKINAGIDVNAKSTSGKTALQYAAYHGQVDVIKCLLANNADAMLCDLNARHVLHYAVMCIKPEQMCATLTLLIKKVDVNAQGIHGLTAFYLLCGGFKITSNDNDKLLSECVKLLLDNDADVNMLVYDMQLHLKTTALHKAIYNGLYYVAKTIIESSTRKINIQDQLGRTPLHYAVLSKNIDILKRLLVERDIDMNIVDNNGKTPGALVNEANIPISLKLVLNEAKKRVSLPSASDIYWMKSMRFFYGSRSSTKVLRVDLGDVHAQLKSSIANKSNQPGNLVTARLTFIVSDKPYNSGGNHKRVLVPIKLQFSEKMHSTNFWKNVEQANTSSFKLRKFRSPDALQRILNRYQHAPKQLKKNSVNTYSSNKEVLSDETIKALYQVNTNDNGMSFEQAFHHSEQAFLDHLEDKKTLADIVAKLKKQTKSMPELKVYAVILSLHSKFYVCANCKVSILGEHAILAKNLKLALEQSKFHVSKKDLKVITTVSADFEAKEVKRGHDEHYDYSIDLRSTHNNIILEQDTRTIVNRDTLYTSRR